MNIPDETPTSPPNPYAAIQEVIATERVWVQAIRDVDIAQLAAIMADEYAVITEDGRVLGKAEELASYGTGDRHWEFAESDEYDVRVYGGTALLIGRWRAKGVNGGYAFDYAARFMVHYVKRNGRWQMSFAQSTTIPHVNSLGEVA